MHKSARVWAEFGMASFSLACPIHLKSEKNSLIKYDYDALAFKNIIRTEVICVPDCLLKFEISATPCKIWIIRGQFG
jgi:hypothetical protein